MIASDNQPFTTNGNFFSHLKSDFHQPKTTSANIPAFKVHGVNSKRQAQDTSKPHKVTKQVSQTGGNLVVIISHRVFLNVTTK